MNFLAGKSRGFTLVEAAVVMLLLSIALVPVVKLASNKAGNVNGATTAASSARTLSLEQAAANAIMEKTIAGDNSVINPIKTPTGQKVAFSKDNFEIMDTSGNTTGTPYRPETLTTPPASNAPYSNFNLAHRTITFPKYLYTDSSLVYNNKIYYQWEVQDASNKEVVTTSGTSTTAEYKTTMPTGNNLVRAVLRVYSGDNSANKQDADFSLSTYFYSNTGDVASADNAFSDKIGIVLALDTSLSMHYANVTGQLITGSPAFAERESFFTTTTNLIGQQLWTKDEHPGSGNPTLPLRTSSGIAGMDLNSVAAPYLTYRPNVNDIYFGGKQEDNPVTPYDERYDPCYDADNPGSGLPYLPAKTYSFAGSVPLGVSCELNNAPPIAPSIFVSIPTRPDHVILDKFDSRYNNTWRNLLLDQGRFFGTFYTSLDNGQLAAATTWPNATNTINVFGGQSVDHLSTSCLRGLSSGLLNDSRCLIFDSNALFSGYNNSTPANWPGPFMPAALAWGSFTWTSITDRPYSVALDLPSTQLYRADLMASSGNDDIVSKTMSRIEAARSAMLAFVQTIESDVSLINNFRLGFVPFSSEVIDGSYTVAEVPLGLNEIVPMQAHSGGQFTTLKNSLYRINRGCNFTYTSGSQTYSTYALSGAYSGYPTSISSNVYGVSCPGDRKPIAPLGTTNIAHAMYVSGKMLDNYEIANSEKFAKKVVILLTDGNPNKGIDAYDYSSGNPTSTASSTSDLLALSTKMGEKTASHEPVNIYAVGLLLGGNTAAETALTAIKNGSPDNAQVNVTSVGDLTPVFEGIAQQAERYALEAQKKRYGHLAY